jgi:hypothetical protein
MVSQEQRKFQHAGSISPLMKNIMDISESPSPFLSAQMPNTLNIHAIQSLT